ncbi:hypothetical protein [Bacillus swezeyi]|nr:hypothetical protein [Bacillus swezeyi]
MIRLNMFEAAASLMVQIERYKEKSQYDRLHSNVLKTADLQKELPCRL